MRHLFWLSGEGSPQSECVGNPGTGCSDCMVHQQANLQPHPGHKGLPSLLLQVPLRRPVRVHGYTNTGDVAEATRLPLSGSSRIARSRELLDLTGPFEDRLSACLHSLGHYKVCFVHCLSKTWCTYAHMCIKSRSIFTVGLCGVSAHVQGAPMCISAYMFYGMYTGK